MSSSELEDEVVSEEDDEGKLYEFIFDMKTTNDKNKTAKMETSSCSRQTPVHSNIHPAGKTHAAGNAVAFKMDALQKSRPVQNVKQNMMPLEGKPWRKTGVEISDYFNYDFDEESWKAYCRKQLSLREVCTRNNNNIVMFQAQKRRAEYGGEETYVYSSSGRPSAVASGKSKAGFKDSEGPSGSSRRKRPLRNSGRNKTEERGSKRSRLEECSPSKKRTSLPFLPFRNRHSTSTLDSGSYRHWDNPSTSQYQDSSVVSSSSQRNKAISTGTFNAEEAWEATIREKSRHYSRDRGAERGENRLKESRYSSPNSREDHKTYKSRVEQGHKTQRSEATSERKRKEDKKEKVQETSHSSSGKRKMDADDAEQRDIYKHRKASRRSKARKNKHGEEAKAGGTESPCSSLQ